MDENYSDKIAEVLLTGNLEKAIADTEKELKALPETVFHVILGRNLLHQQNVLGAFMKRFTAQAQENYKNEKTGFFKKLFMSNEDKNKSLKGIYCSISDFTMEYDQMSVAVSAHHLYDEDEIPMWMFQAQSILEENYTITGYEDLLRIYQKYDEEEQIPDDNSQIASEYCDILIILRIMELFKTVYSSSQSTYSEWNKIPVYISDIDSIYGFTIKQAASNSKF